MTRARDTVVVIAGELPAATETLDTTINTIIYCLECRKEKWSGALSLVAVGFGSPSACVDSSSSHHRAGSYFVRERLLECHTLYLASILYKDDENITRYTCFYLRTFAIVNISTCASESVKSLILGWLVNGWCVCLRQNTQRTNISRPVSTALACASLLLPASESAQDIPDKVYARMKARVGAVKGTVTEVGETERSRSSVDVNSVCVCVQCVCKL